MSRITTIILTLFLLCGVVSAEERVLSLNDALQLAEQNDPSLAKARLDVSAGDARVKEAYSAAMPRVNAEAMYMRYMVLPKMYFSFPGAPPMWITMGQNQTMSADITLTQPIWLAGKVGLALDAAKTYTKLARSLETTNKAQLKANVIKEYYGVQLAREMLEVMKEAQAQAERHGTIVEQMYSAGMASEFSLLQAKVGLGTIVPEVARAEQAVRLSELALINRLGIDPSTSLNLTGKLSDVTPSNWEQPAGDPMGVALKSRSEFEMMDLQKDLYTISMKVNQRSLYLPNFVFVSNYHREASQDQLDIPNSFWTESFRWLVQVSVPIFDGFATPAKVQQDKITLRKIEVDRRMLEQGVRLQVTATLTELKRAEQQMVSSQATVELAERAHSIAQTRFEQGAGTESEVQDARVALQNARLGLLKGIYDLRVAQAEYAMVVENDTNFSKAQ